MSCTGQGSAFPVSTTARASLSLQLEGLDTDQICGTAGLTPVGPGAAPHWRGWPPGLIRTGMGRGWGRGSEVECRAAQAPMRGCGCKALGRALRQLFSNSSIHGHQSKNYTRLPAGDGGGRLAMQRGCREAKTSRGGGYSPREEGRGGCCHGRLTLGQAEPDLHPDTVLISDLLCLNSLICWDICWAPGAGSTDRSAPGSVLKAPREAEVDES